jgi:hypothetical protein
MQDQIQKHIPFTLMTTEAKAQVFRGAGWRRAKGDDYDQTFNGIQIWKTQAKQTSRMWR